MHSGLWRLAQSNFWHGFPQYRTRWHCAQDLYLVRRGAILPQLLQWYPGSDRRRKSRCVNWPALRVTVDGVAREHSLHATMKSPYGLQSTQTGHCGKTLGTSSLDGAEPKSFTATGDACCCAALAKAPILGRWLSNASGYRAALIVTHTKLRFLHIYMLAANVLQGQTL